MWGSYRRKNWGAIQSTKHSWDLWLLKIFICFSSLPRYHSFTQVPKSMIPLFSNKGFNIISRKMRFQSCTKLSMVMDPTDVTVYTMMQSNIDTIIPPTDDNFLTSTYLGSTLLSTMYTATSGAAKHTQQWSFLWFQGGPVDPYSTGHSIAPSEYGKIQQIQDFFIPDTISGNLLENIDPVNKNSETMSNTMTNSADLIKINSGMPGAPRLLQVPDPTIQPTYNTQINKKEIETIASHFDLVMKKIPLAVTLFALIDFFGFGGKDVWNTELEDNRPQAAVDWIAQSSIRVGLAVLVVWVTVFISRWTYHPL